MPETVPGSTEQPQYYDRNPTLVELSYDATVAPHAATSRDTYTVPAGKRALIMSVYLRIMRVTAASSAGNAQILVDRNNGPTYFQSPLPSSLNSIGDQGNPVAIGEAGVLTEGDEIRIRTVDPSTGGTIVFTGALRILEFDAS